MENEEGYYETTYSNYLVKKHERKYDYQDRGDGGGGGDLLLDSQRGHSQLVKVKSPLQQISEADK